ncbi:MAG: hypothetical protein KF746_13430 [Chitinophagaceae bacterium]|nr:hypothetical protein [Chitinophagaceae bacterium]
MKIKCMAIIAIAAATAIFSSCKKNDDGGGSGPSLDKFLIGVNIASASPIIGYVGTMKDLNVGSYTNSKARQTVQYAYVTLHKNDVFVMPQNYEDVVKKYTRQTDGTLAEAGSLTAPASSVPLCAVVESDSRAYLSLYKKGKILVFNPTTMETLNTIDLTSYGLGDANPDPSIMAVRNGKLYVACRQTSNGYSSNYPVQILIIDVDNTSSIISVTDNRSTSAGSMNEQKSLFFDENGDLYVYCVASYGFVAGQKAGFLRIKNGQTSFDPTYFFNTSDYNITDIPGNKIDYLQRFRYAGKGMVYATGNIYALASNPPDYVNDRTYGSFKIDIINQKITKLNIPYSGGQAASVGLFENKVLFGIASTSGVGIYTYEPATNTASVSPVVTTQGDPHQIEVFEE